MKFLFNDYTNNPDDFLISQRIDQLCIIYSKSEVRAAVCLLHVGLESKQHVIVLHLNNIIITYGLNATLDVLAMHGINDRTIDFNLNDKVG